MKPRGLTLVEMVLSASILVLFMAALLWMLPSGKTMWQASTTRSSGQQNLHIAISRIVQELQDSDYGEVNCGRDDNPACSGVTPDSTCKAIPLTDYFYFPSAYDDTGYFHTDSGGNPVWQKNVMYLVLSGTGLIRKESGGSSTTPSCDTSGSWKLISPVILAPSGNPSLSLPPLLAMSDARGKTATLSMTAQTANQQGKIDRQAINNTFIFMRN